MSSTANYKNWHKPNMVMKSDGGSAKTYQGYYRVQNPEKYIGDVKQIIYRSGWELGFCRWCDFSPSIVKWSLEPISVPYYDRVSKLEECKKYGLNPNDPKNWIIKNYHVDFYLEVKKDDEIERWFVEIKPENKLKKPSPPSENATLKEQRIFNNAAKEFLINEAKWAAMDAYAKKNNVKFYVFTEKILEKLLGQFFVNEK